MPEKDIAVKGGDAASTEGVKSKDGSTGAPAGEKDAATLLEEANARIVKITEERDNYKKGMLQAKGKSKEVDDDQDETVDPREVARQAALEVLAESDLIRATRERDELISKMAKENKELRLAVTNRPGSGTATGSNQDGQKVEDHILSESQERALRDRGFTDKMIEDYKKLSSK